MMMARHIGRDGVSFNIHYGCQIENICVSTAAAYLPSMPAEARDRMRTKLDMLPAFTPMSEVIERHADVSEWAIERFRDSNIDERREILTRNLLSPGEADALLKRIPDVEGLTELAAEANALRPEVVHMLGLDPDQFVREFNARIAPKIRLNPLLSALGPYYPEMRHEECAAACRLALLKAGIDVLRQGAQAIRDHADPFGSGPFMYNAFENGFELSSDLTYGPVQIGLDFGVRRD